MKKVCIAFMSVLFVSSMVFAADFVPVNKLDIDVPDFVQYDFGGASVDIPVEITGAPARAFLVIETKGLAATMPRIRNGRIGWHLINGIDTTVFVSPSRDLQTGMKAITWSGMDTDGNPVAEGEYTYYVWAFDYENLMQPACPITSYGGLRGADMLLQSVDENGVALQKPWFTTVYTWGEGDAAHKHTWQKWVLGNDPYNLELVETCNIEEVEGWSPNYNGRCSFQPDDFNYIYKWTNNVDESLSKAMKLKLNPNDVAELQDWGTDLVWEYPIYPSWNGISTDGAYLYAPIWFLSKTDANPRLIVFTFDGDEVADVYMEEFDEPEYVAEHEGIWRSGGPQSLDTVQLDDGSYYYNMGTSWCFQCAISPIRWLESGDYEDLFHSYNHEGDYFVDKGQDPSNPNPDYCYGEGDPMWHYANYVDAYGFSLVACERGGPISWALMAPDHTGVDFCTIAGETDVGQQGVLPVNVGSAYDGVYLNPKNQEGLEAGVKLWYLGADSDKGIISKTGGVGVAAAAPAAFAVAQNSPNPANPTTTISFTIPEAGNVSVDVFNVAGQRVDTIVNDFMDAGSHSIVWDGSSLASGVYFYTVTSSEFSKTMKMTLLK